MNKRDEFVGGRWPGVEAVELPEVETPPGLCTPGEIEVFNAARAAIRDFFAGTGGFYNGPAAGIYLRVIGTLQTERARYDMNVETEDILVS